MTVQSDPKDDALPLTRGDLRRLEVATKADIYLLKQEMTIHMNEKTGEMKSHFDIVAEQMLHDFKGAFNDKLSLHDDRLTRLEKQTGLKRA